MAWVPTGPDEERIEDPRYVVRFSPGAHFWSVQVGRIRLEPGEVDAVVAEIRELARERGRAASVWTVGDASTPPGLAATLEDLGLEREGISDVLLLTRAPAREPADFDVREVASPTDLATWIDVSAAAFGWPEEDTADERARAEATYAAERSDPATSRLLAFDGDRPVAVGRAWRSAWGLYLGGGATLPSDRRRGAMTALLVAAWDEAARLGTPALVAHGSALSTPVLAGLGFERVGGTVHLIDRL